MPFKKRKEHKIIKQAIKKRLMEISIYVEKFVYKDKPITLEEANKYIDEISLHRARCNNDAHIIQVIEKLTRSLKIIIDGAKIAPEIQRRSEYEEESINLVTECTVSQQSIYENHNKLIDTCKLQAMLIGVQTKNKHGDPNAAESTVISESENEENKNTDIPSYSYKSVNELPVDIYKVCDTQKNYLLHSSSLYSNNGISKVSYTGNKNRTVLATQSYLFNQNIQFSNTINTNTAFERSNVVNEVYTGITTSKTKEIIDCSSDLVLKINENNNETIVKSVENTQDMATLCLLGKENKKKKMNRKKTQSLIPGSQNVTENKSSINTGTRGRKTTAKTQNRKPKKQTKNKKSENHYKTTNKIIENNAPAYSFAESCQASNSKSKPIKVINDTIISSINNVEPTPIADVIATQMGALRIDNKLIEIDLSWINDIGYVREFHMDEFEQAPNRYHDNFWDSFKLPNGWSDAEFLD